MISNEAKIIQAFDEVHMLIAYVCEHKLSKSQGFDRIAAIMESDELVAAMSPQSDEIVPIWPRVP